VKSPAALAPAERAELTSLVRWAIRAAVAVAEAQGLPEEELVSAALHAVEGGKRTHDPALGPLGPHVRRRVRGELSDASRSIRRRRSREVLFDDVEALAPGLEDDEITLSRALGVEALVMESPEESLLLREKQGALAREVDKLPAADKRLYTLRHREGRTWEEIHAEARDHQLTMRHIKATSFALVLTVTALAPLAHAQPSRPAPAAASGTRADDLAHKGNDLALKHKWTEAAALFRQAWALKQSYDIGGNLGISELALGNHRDAAEHLAFALGHFPANGKPEHRELLREKLAKAREQVGARTIEVDVAGAEVWVDGARIGAAPLAGEVFLDPGTRTVEARLAGYESAKRTIDVTKGSSDTITLVLRRSVATPPPVAPVVEKRPIWPAVVSGVLAAGGLAAGVGLTVAANGKGRDAATLRAKLGGGRSTCAGTTTGADCGTLADALRSQGTLAKAALGSFVIGGAFAAAGVGLGVWASAKAAPVQVVPVMGAAERGVVVVGSW